MNDDKPSAKFWLGNGVLAEAGDAAQAEDAPEPTDEEEAG